MSQKGSSRSTALSRFIPLSIFLAVSIAIFSGITYLAPTWGAGEVPTLEALGETGTLKALHGAVAVLIGFIVSLFTTMVMMPRRNVDPSTIPPYPRYPAMSARGADDEAPTRSKGLLGRQMPIPLPRDPREASYTVLTRADDTEIVCVTVKGMSGAQFKKKGGLRSKLQKIVGIKWQHPKNDAEEKTITMTGAITSSNRGAVLGAVEALAAPRELVESYERMTADGRAYVVKD